VPSVVFPNVSLAQGFPNTYARCTSTTMLCAEGQYLPWTAGLGADNYAGTNDQSEKTKACTASCASAGQPEIPDRR
jgi:hypothetical protein